MAETTDTSATTDTNDTTVTTVTTEGIPVITADPFSLENLANPHPLHKQLREAGPVVRLESYGVWGMARIELAGQPRRKPNNTLRAWTSLPVTVYASPA